MLGTIGYIAIVIALLSALVASIGFACVAYQKNNTKNKTIYAVLYVHVVAVWSAITVLLILLLSHQYQYHYVWQHSSNDMPLRYILSSLWEGQEGSFLLWSSWIAFLMLLWTILGKVKPMAMAVVLLFQLCLLSMVVGFAEIGSSPFALLKDVIKSPVYQINPNFIPTDGTGLNPLLQSYWMTIHPPIIFLAYALALFPFAIMLGNLILNQFNEGFKNLLPWLISTVFFLGMGIMMGAYWAYETLNFGGYWNWDPVENAVYVPWIIFVASLHAMLIYERKGIAYRLSSVLVLLSFILIIYATFLTRSGILGNSSVHSFTDLGLSGQLLFVLLFFLTSAVLFVAIRWKSMPSKKEEHKPESESFWMNIGIVVLSVSALQVILPTSFPVINAVGKWLGFRMNLAMPTNPEIFFTTYQLWIAVAILFLTGYVVKIFLHQPDRSIGETLFVPIVCAIVSTASVVLVKSMYQFQYIAFVLVAFWCFYANIYLLYQRRQMLLKQSGAFAHIGLAVMLLGVFFSSAYKTTLTDTTPVKHELNRAENVLLLRDKETPVRNYNLVYKGAYHQLLSEEKLSKDKTLTTNSMRYVMLRNEVHAKDSLYHQGDILEINPEFSYYELSFLSRENKQRFTLLPKIQQQGSASVVASPDIAHFFTGDVYAHVSNFPDPLKVNVGVDTKHFVLEKKNEHIVDGVSITLVNIEKIEMNNLDNDKAYRAEVKLRVKGELHWLYPVWVQSKDGISDNYYPDMDDQLGIKMLYLGGNPNRFAITQMPKDWITVKAIFFPFIHLVWSGTILLLFGCALSFTNRIKQLCFV